MCSITFKIQRYGAKMTELKGEINNSTITVGDFNIFIVNWWVTRQNLVGS